MPILITLKLTPENYPLWHEQIIALAESQDMVGFFIGEKVKPIMYTNVTIDKASTTEEEAKQIAAEFLKWQKEDRLLCESIIGTLKRLWV